MDPPNVFYPVPVASVKANANKKRAGPFFVRRETIPKTASVTPNGPALRIDRSFVYYVQKWFGSVAVATVEKRRAGPVVWGRQETLSVKG